MNACYFSSLILFFISTVKCDGIPNSKSTVFKGIIGCNTTISDSVLNPINYPYHTWQLQLNINNTIKCTAEFNIKLFLSNTTSQTGFLFNAKGELLNNSKSIIIPNKTDNISTYYIQIKASNEYKFQILCYTKCFQSGHHRQLLSIDSNSDSSSFDGSSDDSSESSSQTPIPTTTTEMITTTTTEMITTTTTEMITTTTTEMITTTAAPGPARHIFEMRDASHSFATTTHSDSIMEHSLVIYFSKKTYENLYALVIIVLLCNIAVCWVYYKHSENN